MRLTEKHIVETYLALFEGLSTSTKIGLIEILSESLKVEETSKEDAFYNSFGAFSSEKSAEEIIQDIKSSRTFRRKDIKF